MTNEESDLDEFAPWLVLIITLAGGFMRVLYLGNKGMWLDEAFSVWLAGHTVPEMLQWIVRIDQHPPLYYLLLHAWIALNGDTPYYARLLSALIGMVTIPVIYLTGRRLGGMAVGLAAAVLLALSPFNIFFSQETRMYTLLTFNAAVAIYALARLLSDPRSARPIGSQLREALHAWRTPGLLPAESVGEFSYQDLSRAQSGWRGWASRHRWPSLQSLETDLAWLAFILFSAATLLSHNTAVFFLLAANLYVLGLMFYQNGNKSRTPTALQAPSLGSWLKAQAGILLLWAVWLVPFIRQAWAVDRRFWIPAPDWQAITGTLRSLLNPYGPGQSGQVIIMWMLVAVLVLGLLYYRKRLSIFLFLAALFAIPFLAELLVSLRRPIFYNRTLIWTTIPLLLLLAAGIAQLRVRPLMILMLGIIGTNYLFTAGDYYRFFQKEDWSSAAGYVAKFAEKDDLVLFNSNFVVVAFDYYFKPFEDKYLIRVQKQGLPADLYKDGRLEPLMTESDIPALVSLLQGRQRVWLVYSHDSYTDPQGMIPRTLASQMKLLRERDFYGGKVQLYGAP